MDAVVKGNSHPYTPFRLDVRPALQSKLEEFILCDCERVTEDELWNFLLKKKWKKAKDDIHLYEVIQDILSVKVSDFFSYTSIDFLKTNDFSLKDADEMKELLK